uniref:C2H2-type domain-containing protein n=1 Tax=Timema bartmani TaxID=61472 RepID=A0A7R9ERM6_9NEOP|nr:unnamed protein product [Timema bartmani]
MVGLFIYSLTQFGLKTIIIVRLIVLQCDKCKCFTLKSSLLQHTLTYSELEPFKCVKCGECFTHKSSLMRHPQSFWI